MLNTCIVDQQIEPTERGERQFDHLAYRRRLRHVCGRMQHANVEFRRDLGLRLGDTLGGAEAIKDDFRSGGRERTSDAETDTASRPGNERNAPAKRTGRGDAFRPNGDVHDRGSRKDCAFPAWPQEYVGRAFATPMPIGYTLDRAPL